MIKGKIIDLLRKTNRPGIDNLINYLQNESDFFTAPCSSQYHLPTPSGLAQHSLNVYDLMIKVCKNTGINLPDSVIIAALLHDIGKSTYYGKPCYVPNMIQDKSNKGQLKQSEAKPYEKNKDRSCLPHELASVHIISKYIQLTEDETTAIYYHNGLYSSTGRDINGKETPLMLALHFADMYCSRFLETETA